MVRSSLVALGLAAHVLSASAAPTSSPAQEKRRFSLPAVRAAVSGQDAQASQTQAAATGSETASIQVGSNWFIPVSIGTPPQSFLMLGDTGAPTLSVANTLEPANLQGPNPLFNPNKSSTAVQIPGEKYSTAFVSGYSSSGVVFKDTFRVGDLVLEGMPIGLPTEHSATKSSGPSRSGNLGLDFAKDQPMTPAKEPTWLASIMPRLEAGLFTVNWDKSAGTGTWDFGYIDKSKYTGEIAYSALHSPDGGAGWTCQISKGSNSMYVTVDTGTSDTHVTAAIAKDFFTGVSGASFDASSQTWTYPCSSSLPNFTFEAGGTQVSIPGSVIEGSSVGSGKCRSALQVGAASAEKLIWGQNFIAAMFVVFDWDNARLGFASK